VPADRCRAYSPDRLAPIHHLQAPARLAELGLAALHADGYVSTATPAALDAAAVMLGVTGRAAELALPHAVRREQRNQ
jgi:hypothetical protein